MGLYFIMEVIVKYGIHSLKDVPKGKILERDFILQYRRNKLLVF